MKLTYILATIYNENTYGYSEYSTGTVNTTTPVTTTPSSPSTTYSPASTSTSSVATDETSSTTTDPVTTSDSSTLNNTSNTGSVYVPTTLGNVATEVSNTNYGVIILIALGFSVLIATIILVIKRARRSLDQY